MMTSDILIHHGILGQKWGIRRFQNQDGTLTDAGKKRYNKKVLSYTIYDMKKDLDKSPKLAYKNAQKKMDVLNEIAREYEDASKKAPSNPELSANEVLDLYDKYLTANNIAVNWVLQMTAVFSKMSLEDLRKNDIDEGFYYVNEFFTNPNNKDALDWLNDDED